MAYHGNVRDYRRGVGGACSSTPRRGGPSCSAVAPTRHEAGHSDSFSGLRHSPTSVLGFQDHDTMEEHVTSGSDRQNAFDDSLQGGSNSSSISTASNWTSAAPSPFGGAFESSPVASNYGVVGSEPSSFNPSSFNPSSRNLPTTSFGTSSDNGFNAVTTAAVSTDLVMANTEEQMIRDAPPHGRVTEGRERMPVNRHDRARRRHRQHRHADEGPLLPRAQPLGHPQRSVRPAQFRGLGDDVQGYNRRQERNPQGTTAEDPNRIPIANSRGLGHSTPHTPPHTPAPTNDPFADPNQVWCPVLEEWLPRTPVWQGGNASPMPFVTNNQPRQRAFHASRPGRGAQRTNPMTVFRGQPMCRNLRDVLRRTWRPPRDPKPEMDLVQGRGRHR